MKNLVLAIDQSTSATKAMLFTLDSGLLDKTSITHQQYYPQPGWVEHDADEIYRNTCAAIATLMERNTAHQNDLLCLSITNQRETFVVFDKITGVPLHNAIVWQCRRGESRCDDLIAAGHNDRVKASTGLKIDTYFPASKIQWLLTNYPDICQRVAAGDALIGTIDTYLIYRLTKGRVFATDATNASRTLLFDIQTLSWSTELCDLFGVPPHALAEVRDSSATYGETDADGAISAPLPICGVMGDSQAALYAQRCFDPGGAKVTFGTGSSVLLNIGNKPRFGTTGTVTTVGWVTQGNPVYAFEGIINSTGATIAWLQNQLQLISSPQETEALALSVKDSDGVYLVPAFVGLSAPYWRSDVKAAIVGLTTSTTKAHVVRAALESIAYQVKDALDQMGQDAGTPVQLLHGDGGMVSNHFLMQFTADLIGCTLRASSLPELSALGAAFAGMLGAGAYHDQSQIAQIPLEFVDYTPTPARARVNELYAGWQSAVKRVL